MRFVWWTLYVAFLIACAAAIAYSMWWVAVKAISQ